MANIETIVSDPSMRKRRFSKILPSTGETFNIPDDWTRLQIVPQGAHDEKYLSILKKHRIEPNSPVPLVGRYSKPRRWSAEELAACVEAHHKGIPISLMSAALNRNPQDIIYRLLDECSANGISFAEVGLKASYKWNDAAVAAARDLFEAGLTAWRIAALFGVDFEGVEKTLYMGRDGYGHVKKNPFAICTDHKQLVNSEVLRIIPSPDHALDAFAGEGRFAEKVIEGHPHTRLICIEQDENTFNIGKTSRAWPETVSWFHSDNVHVMTRLREEGRHFDLIDLDPFVSCRDQIDYLWPLLDDRTALFVTFGGEYRRSFIGTNRKAIAKRYGFYDAEIQNSDYLEVIPSYFYGWLANEAASHGFILQVHCAIRYPNNCRFWLTAMKSSEVEVAEWKVQNIEEINGGYFWRDLYVPRFSEIRKKKIEELVSCFPYGETTVHANEGKTVRQLEFSI
jgi:hypothetical protein